MTTTNRLCLWACATVMSATPALAGWFGPSDRDECMVEAAKSARTQSGLGILIRDCYAKFPPPRRVCESIAAEASKAPPPSGYTYNWSTGERIPVDPEPESSESVKCRSLYPAMFQRKPSFFGDIFGDK